MFIRIILFKKSVHNPPKIGMYTNLRRLWIMQNDITCGVKDISKRYTITNFFYQRSSYSSLFFVPNLAPF